jgi:hypothetical protein
MKMLRAVGSVLLVLAGCAGNSAFADSSDCQDTISRYNSAIDDVASTLKRYSSCVSSSNGKDDCSSEFHRLKTAQSDFEDAVNAVRSECN